MGTSAATYGDDNCDERRMSMEDGAKRSTEIELIKTFKSDHDQQKRQQKQSMKCIPTTYGGAAAAPLSARRCIDYRPTIMKYGSNERTDPSRLLI